MKKTPLNTKKITENFAKNFDGLILESSNFRTNTNKKATTCIYEDCCNEALFISNCGNDAYCLSHNIY